jgi:S-formylglutathione hydrolase FrmB
VVKASLFLRWWTTFVVVGFLCPIGVVKAQERFGGRVWDFTRNSGRDYRFFSPSLNQKRDVYVYTPPGFQWRTTRRYPLMIWLHGYMGDERDFLLTVVPYLDHAIRTGRCPALIAVAPDGSIEGDFPRDDPYQGGTGSWFVNSRQGRFEDYVMKDLWDWVHQRLPVVTDPKGHVVAGWSMGGFAAFNYALKYRDRIKIVAAVSPPVNMRYVGLNGTYDVDFRPGGWGLRRSFWNPNEVLVYFPVRYSVLGIPAMAQVPITAELWFGPVWGLGTEGAEFVGRESPLEILAQKPIRPGELAMYIAYAKDDPLNIDAQVESFVWYCRESKIPVDVVAGPYGGHTTEFLESQLPGLFRWVGDRLRESGYDAVPKELAARGSR